MAKTTGDQFIIEFFIGFIFQFIILMPLIGPIMFRGW